MTLAPRAAMVAATAVTALSLSSIASAADYEIAPLGSVPGTWDVYVKGVNTSGEAVGYAVEWDAENEVNVNRAVRWDADGTAHLLPTLSNTNLEAEAYRINSAGQIVGTARDDNGVGHAVMWDDTGLVDIGMIGTGSAYANDINDHGVVAGFSNDGISSRAFTWTAEGGFVDYGNFDPGGYQQYGGFNGINNNGLMVGTGYQLFSPFKAALAYEGDRNLTDISVPGQYSTSMAMAVNDAGTIVGFQSNDVGAWAPAIFDGRGGAEFLDLIGYDEGQALDINNDGAIVGYLLGFDPDTGEQRQTAFVNIDGQTHDLFELIGGSESGWDILFTADSISDAGHIVGAGVYNGEIRGYTIVIPEPTTAGLLACWPVPPAAF